MADDVGGTCGKHGRGYKYVGKRLWWESPKERDHSEDQGVDGRMESVWLSKRLVREQRRFSWLRIWTGDGLL
jgi:hypothetical protein